MIIPYTYLIFLDFDGVLHRGTSGTFRKVPLLDQFLARHPQVGIVLSTNWRMSEDLESLKGYFTDPETARRIFDLAPDLPAARHGARQREIELWLRQHQFTGGFTALDDSPDLFDRGWEPLMLTDPREGLTAADMDALAIRVAAAQQGAARRACACR
jgi:DNA-binding transcriptional LysR family regulator